MTKVLQIASRKDAGRPLFASCGDKAAERAPRQKESDEGDIIPPYPPNTPINPDEPGPSSTQPGPSRKRKFGPTKARPRVTIESSSDGEGEEVEDEPKSAMLSPLKKPNKPWKPRFAQEHEQALQEAFHSFI
jgi:hypothetical protein